jgi:MATE family multidrug resistance protein
LGVIALGATNIAFQVDLLGLIPMQGIGIGVSILVGQYIGAGQPNYAERAGYSGMQIALTYILPLSFAYVMIPEAFLFLFRDAQGHNDAMLAVAAPLLGFAALVSLFDAIAIATSSAIKGAGDTHFVVWFAALTSPVLLILPTWLSLTVFHRGLYTVWTIAITYWSCLGLVFLLRFRQGKWKSMKVIEDPVLIDIKEPISLIP